MSSTSKRLIAVAGATDPSVDTARNVAEFGGRILLSAIFLVSGFGKIGAYAGTAAYMSSQGVPGALLPFVIATEFLGADASLLGGPKPHPPFLLPRPSPRAGLA